MFYCQWHTLGEQHLFFETIPRLLQLLWSSFSPSRNIFLIFYWHHLFFGHDVEPVQKNWFTSAIRHSNTTRTKLHRWWRRMSLSGGWEEEVFAEKMVSIQREQHLVKKHFVSDGQALWTSPDWTLRRAIWFQPWRLCSFKWNAARCRKVSLQPGDPTTTELRRICLEGQCEKDPLELKNLSIALFHVRQVMRRTQADLRFKEATEVGTPARLKGPPPPTRPRFWKRWTQTEERRVWKFCRDVRTSRTATSRSSSRIPCTGTYQNGYGSDGHEKCYILPLFLTARG